MSSFVSAEMHPQAAAIRDAVVARGTTVRTVEESRRRLRQLAESQPEGPSIREVRDVLVTVADGTSLPVRVFDGRSESDVPAATVVYLHGGGWVAGDVDAFDTFSRAFARAAACRVVSVGYRLSPEAAFGEALDDALASCTWAADEFPGAPLVVMGDSAGGNLAAVCALLSRDGSAPRVDLQVLVYPMVHRDVTSSSHVEHASDGLMTSSDVDWYWRQYLGEHSADNFRAQPGLAALDGVAPAIVVVAEHDPLRDDGLSYAARLSEAGVPVETMYYADMPHGFFTMIGLLDSQADAVERVGLRVRSLCP